MGGIWAASSNFTKGELDPLLNSRTDLAAYYQGAEEALNVLAIPQGGLKKRPGTEYIGTALGEGRIENFSFNVDENYMIVFTDLRMQIYKDDVLQTNINGSGNDYLAIPHTLAQIKEMDYLQSADTIILVQEDLAPRIIQRTSDTDWTITTITYFRIPTFDFNDALSPTPTDEIQTLTFVNVADGDQFKISLEGILTDIIIYNATDNTATERDMERALQALPNTGNTGITVLNTAPEAYTVTFSGDSADNWEPLSVTPFIVQNPAFSAAVATTQDGASSSEPVWSSTRGFQRTATFHENRLWFGGSQSRPATLWGSRANDLFNFDMGQARDDEAIEATLATDQINAINGIISNRSLQIFTSGAEFYVPESPITPSNVSVSPQTNLGSKRVRPIVMEGITIFIQRTGKALYQYQFINEFQANESRSISILAPHLINNPTQMAVRRGAPTSDANYMYLVNEVNGMTVFNSNGAEGVQAFTRWETEGDIISVAVVDDEVKTLVKRSVGGGDVYYLETENDDLNTDSGKIETVNSDTLTGLTHLEGKTVEVKADGSFMGEFVVSGGEITIERQAVVIEAGLPWRPCIRTMPFSVSLNNGPNFAQKKRILRCAVDLFESNGVTVNGERIADKTIGVDQFDPVEPQTGLKRIFLHGWSLEASIEITQISPMPMTILGLNLEVKV